MAKKQKVFPNIPAKFFISLGVLAPSTPAVAPTKKMGTGFRGEGPGTKLKLSGKADAHQIGKK